jgi:hypothetical protein
LSGGRIYGIVILGNSQSEFVANLAIIDGDKPSLNLIFVM